MNKSIDMNVQTRNEPYSERSLQRLHEKQASCLLLGSLGHV